MKKTSIPIFIFLVCLFVSCKKNSTELTTVPSEQVSTPPDELRTQFAQILAKAVANPGVRELIKSEALKKFDNDYDVLFHLIKEKNIPSGGSLESYLNSLAPSDISFSKLSQADPLLTIMVPQLPGFSAEKWNVDQQIPLVAVVNNDYDEKKKTKLKAFDSEGNVIELPSDKDPGRPVIVVKENERLMAVGRNVRIADSKDNYVFSNGNLSFYFKGDLFNPEKTRGYENAIVKPDNQVDSRLKQAYTLNTASQRDYVYYGILNSPDQGPLDNNYQEYISGFYINSTGSLGYVYDDPSSDWSDGDFEFQVDVLFFNGTSALSKVSKVFSISRSSIYYDDDGDGTNTIFWYIFPTPIPIATWDMQANGNTWKYVVNEIDPSSVTTTTHASSSKFGANFTYSATIEKVIKLGLGFGGSAETTSTNTVQVQTTTGSDFCGEGVVNFVHPVVTGTFNVGPFLLYVYNVVNTGTVSLMIEPRHI